ncbi:MAG TPA: SCP2 sterol-binding domain-containing protein [Solirubrobacteraceae bacterium]|nr:SCP2 sterol-binding domain-containing protein [Solirubrobacteraceae bacterium]
MSSSDAKPLIEGAVRRFLDEVPALKPMKLVVKLELRGRGDEQQFRIELPDVKVTKDVAGDAKVTVHMQRAFFNEMAKDAKVADWREAFMYGQAKASGPTQILQLIERVVDKQEERNRQRRAKQH